MFIFAVIKQIHEMTKFHAHTATVLFSNAKINCFPADAYRTDVVLSL